MKFSIEPLDLHHYEVFMLHPIQEKTYMGSATISLDGTNVNIYCENKRMKKYSEILGKQAYSYYSNKIGI